MTSTYHPGAHRFSIFVVCWTVLLFVAGALVTSKDAALSVTDWPKSHGTWVPPLTMLQGGDLFEFSHRVVAGGLGLLTIALAVLLCVKETRSWLRWLGLSAVLGVAVQAILGGQVVIRLLHYWLPVIHACFAQIVFGAVLAVALFTSKWWVSDQPQLEDSGTPSIHSLAILNAMVIYLQVILGAGFRHKEIPIWPHLAGALLVLGIDRKSTRLNSSHLVISYAVFCLKKKKRKHINYCKRITINNSEYLKHSIQAYSLTVLKTYSLLDRFVV